ncbi:ATP-grasp domain-containing protein [Streptomyces bambusae]|uniref:ATP-grasp domain-containing protein n=1 Tax=Streptomyces bambusae TaxID=1550616 RepID=UPI001CFCC767|nr:ATP-grasp domain-containing protein [Streptomyces bambusae]MCB5168181.1 ATP-grasp domain-containing protein [Streptomyces bambusae]
MKSVLIFSKLHFGGVALVAEQLRARGLRSVLVSELPDNRHRDTCDDHVLVDWESEDLSVLTTRLEQRGIVPVAVVNMLESLASWHMGLAAHYGIPGAEESRRVLLDKVLVRERMQALGLSGIRFSDDPATADFFPAIVKPSRDSGASRLVSRVDGPQELLAYRHRLADAGLADTELIIEEYLPGVEFSVDGPVVDGRFHPVLAVEKPEHDDVRHHDAGLEFHPPQQDHVREGVRVLCERITALCTDLRLGPVWLHLEGRAAEDGRTELIEINPRPGGGMIPAAVREISGIDPIEALVSMALGEFTLDGPIPLRDRPVIGWIDMEGSELGTVQVDTTEADLRELPGVVGALITNGYRITDLEQENFFLRFAVVADSVSRLRERVETVRSKVEYRITPPPAS